MTPLWKKLLLLAAGLLFGLVLAEILLRIAGISYPLPYEPDEYCGTRLKAGFRGWWTKEGRAFIRINRYGFRHGDRGPAKPPGVWRVAVLGDSFIEAFQVDEDQTLCGVLERQLSDDPAWAERPVQVLNFGVSGFGTAQQLQMLRHYVWPYQPDLVVLAFFPGNDVRNNSPELESYRVRPFFRLENDTLELDDRFRQHPDYRKARSAAVRAKVWLINRSRLLQLLNEIRSRHGQPPEAAAGAAGPGIDEAALIFPPDDRWHAAWELTDRLVLEVQQEVQRRGARFLLLVIGSDFQVHPDPEVEEGIRRRLAVDDLQYGERRLTELGRRHGFPVLSLIEPMRRHARQHERFLHGFENTQPGIGHWNAAGNRLAAERTADAIRELEAARRPAKP
jgi:hypothetical protein